jgi:hypothetical protein
VNLFLKTFAAIFLLAFSCCLKAQEPVGLAVPPSRDMIAAWLQRGEPREVAWAAVYALQEKDAYFLPALLALAGRWEPLPHRNVLDSQHPFPILTETQRERRDAMSAILDAIIQWHGALAAATVRNLADDFPAAAFTLLSQMPPADAEPVLLALYGDPQPSSWDTQRTAASLLALHPPAGFAASLLKSTMVATRVFVTLPDDQSLGEGASNGSCGGYSSPAAKLDWPEIGRFSLREGGTFSTVVPYATIPGLAPIKIVRIVTPANGEDPQTCGGLTLTSIIRMTLLAQMLGSTPQRMPFKVRDQVNLKVVNAQDYQRSIGEYVDKEESAFQQLKAQLADKQLLSPAEAAEDAVLPSLVLLVSDYRSTKTFPLPQFQFRLPNVRQSSGPSAFFFE